jgi:serine protease DegS
LDDPIFRHFFGNPKDLITPRKRVETSLGSGVIMSDKGFILTNHHVIKSADAIQVSLQDGRMAEAKVVGGDPETDIAVLKINLKKLPVMTLGRSDGLRVGDVVLAIGNPFGVGQTVTMGIVSATGRNKLGISTFENFIQTDAAINPGNSGGALIDAEGNLVGINTAIFSRSGGNQGIGFAIPTNLAENIMQEILQHGRPLRGWLGVEAQSITPQIAKALELEKSAGVVVVGVIRDGPAHRAGIQPGDVIISIDKEKITEARQALIAISSRKPGSRVMIEVLRNGKQVRLEAVAIERPPKETAPDP